LGIAPEAAKTVTKIGESVLHPRLHVWLRHRAPARGSASKPAKIEVCLTSW
jgi:hypothetical protein